MTVITILLLVKVQSNFSMNLFILHAGTYTYLIKQQKGAVSLQKDIQNFNVTYETLEMVCVIHTLATNCNNADGGWHNPFIEEHDYNSLQLFNMWDSKQISLFP